MARKAYRCASFARSPDFPMSYVSVWFVVSLIFFSYYAFGLILFCSGCCSAAPCGGSRTLKSAQPLARSDHKTSWAIVGSASGSCDKRRSICRDNESKTGR